MTRMNPPRHPHDGRRVGRNVVVSFGLYEGSPEDHERIRDGHGDDRTRLDRISDHVDETLIEGVFEVVDEVAPAGLR